MLRILFIGGGGSDVMVGGVFMGDAAVVESDALECSTTVTTSYR